VKLREGLYEAPVTGALEELLRQLETAIAAKEPITAEAAPHILGRVIHDAAVRAMRNVPAKERLALQVALANRVLEVLGEAAPEAGISDDEAVRTPPELLLSLRPAEDVRLGKADIERPTLPLRHSDLLVNGPRDLRVGHEVRLELASADRVDLLVSFVKWSGFRLLRSELASFLARRPGGLRVLTTTYLGASDAEAIEALLELGAQVKVSYETRRTRLHAKAWLFHRDSGFHTAFIGSSNLSTAAMLDGCEWNVRLSAVDNAAILNKFVTTFDQYWDDTEFEAYERERFAEATRRRDESRDALARAVQLRPYPHQQGVLDALATERSHGRMRNLVVAATGTGKTVIAALDYARLKKEWGDPSLLFVAHRREILTQSLATFRAAVRDGHFGELLVGDERPTIGKHVFSSIQALHADRLAKLSPTAYDVVIVDEFHHAEGDTYKAVLNHLKPKVLLGLTATPERTDGESILGWFDGRIAAELRLWHALDHGLVVPFQYFGIHDGTDLSSVGFSGGRYDINDLEKIYTGDHVRANNVLRALSSHIHEPSKLRALGFCVSVRHAEFMASFFTQKGVPSLAVSAETPRQQRNDALQALRSGEVKVLFSRDIFNEGIDVPSVNTVLFLRPTESATVFLQQLGRGLRHEDGKSCLTVLDFIGNAHRKFRFDARFRALLGGTRVSVRNAVETGFPFLPAGCEIQLDRESQEAVLANIRASLGSDDRRLVEELRTLGDVSLAKFLEATELEPEDLYRSGRCLTNLKRAAGVLAGEEIENEVTRAFTRMLHIDDDVRLDTWRAWLKAPKPPEADEDDPLQLMFFTILGHAVSPLDQMQAVFDELWATPDLRREVIELFDVLSDRQRHSSYELAELPFRVHSTYSRDEVSAGLRATTKNKKKRSTSGEDKLIRLQGGVYNATHVRVDVLFVTLNKDPDHFSPTTLYNDYPISQTRFHWESQGKTRADSDTGRRYRGLEDQPWRILLFVRKEIAEGGTTSPYLCLGSVHYVTHESEKPMQIIWELERPMPATFFDDTKVAAG
jgi:superfamily II DNA or RNA helicase